LLSEENAEDQIAGYRSSEIATSTFEEGNFIMTKHEGFTSVWDAVEDTPQEAANMRARSRLMIDIAKLIRLKNLTQAEAAKTFGVTQPRISDLIRGKIDLFSVDTLINMAATAGMLPTIKLKMPKKPAVH
jgi:predicted XRE-type DNA-binding protein